MSGCICVICVCLFEHVPIAVFVGVLDSSAVLYVLSYNYHCIETTLTAVKSVVHKKVPRFINSERAKLDRIVSSFS